MRMRTFLVDIGWREGGKNIGGAQMFSPWAHQNGEKTK